MTEESAVKSPEPDWRDQDMVETCQDCGQRVGLVWTAPDVLWTAVTGRADGGGVFCPVCFDRRAFAQGRFIRWVPQQEDPDNRVIESA